MKENNPDTTQKNIEKDKSNFRKDLEPFRLFFITERLGRIRYFVYTSIIFIIENVLILLLYKINPELTETIEPYFYTILIAIFIILTIQRCHDFNMTGWISILTLVFPLINLPPIPNIVFMLIPGTKGQNKYGFQPPPNSSSIQNIATLLIILIVLFTPVLLIFLKFIN